MNRLLELERSLTGRKRRRAQPRRYSRPFYATGEHVLAGEDLAAHEQAIKVLMTDLVLEVGAPDARGKYVGFSYGELVAMGDLFDSFDEMDRASADELMRLRTLIRKDRDHYAKAILGTGAGGPDVGDSDWQKTTSGRYVKLAFDNFAHFAPTDPTLTATVKGADPRDHRMMWEQYHLRAVKLAKAATNSRDLQRALAINAFGDHFLTDAFAAGHLFNKADVSERFNAKFMNAKGELSALGASFLKTLAQRSWFGPLKEAFSKHETVAKEGLHLWGWIVFAHHHNIDSAGDFEQFLRAIHEAEPKFVGDGLVARVVHDKLNHYPGGLPVSNAAGDKPWNLTGDDTLNRETLTIMRKAVARSVYDVAVEAQQVSNLDALRQYAWFYTPRPTAAGKALIKNLIDTYSDPANPLLMNDAVALLQKKYPVILQEAVDRGKLQLDD